jgi:hypothetical protein
MIATDSVPPRAEGLARAGGDLRPTHRLPFPDRAKKLHEAVVHPTRRSADATDGAAAFAEKRDPVWQGA